MHRKTNQCGEKQWTYHLLNPQNELSHTHTLTVTGNLTESVCERKRESGGRREEESWSTKINEDWTEAEKEGGGKKRKRERGSVSLPLLLSLSIQASEQMNDSKK